MKTLNMIFEKITLRFGDLGMAVLLLMMLVILSDIVLRRVFNRPLSWSFEIIGQLLVAVVFFTVAYCTFQKAHVSIDALVSRSSPAVRRFFSIFGLLWGFITFGLVTWASTLYAIEEMGSGYATGILHISIYPFREYSFKVYNFTY